MEPCRGRFMLEASSKCDSLCDKLEQQECYNEMIRKEKHAKLQKQILDTPWYRRKDEDKEVVGQTCARGNCE